MNHREIRVEEKYAAQRERDCKVCGKLCVTCHRLCLVANGKGSKSRTVYRLPWCGQWCHRRWRLERTRKWWKEQVMVLRVLAEALDAKRKMHRPEQVGSVPPRYEMHGPGHLLLARYTPPAPIRCSSFRKPLTGLPCFPR